MSKTKTEEKKATQIGERQRAIIDYTPIADTPQAVLGFDGTDKTTKNAEAAFVITRYLIANKGMKSFSASDAHNVVLEQTGIALSSYYPGSSYSDSPLHKALHAISKGETMERRKLKDGTYVDSVARGIRGLLLKDFKVGLQQVGMYHKNTDPAFRKYYKKVEPAELKSACELLVQNSKRIKK